ncbi:CASC3, exon junction complex subunit S homeolog isoform X2 [Xenopus laevis]|uniref:Protein CASC3 n=1 Tax=Xenopus laevis TaxID=8355 RepID=A0A8J1LW96_XENLA|nr:CASC3, exon junction complex subunit S homeolog isoform X2 [Xenopus laevis]
MADRRRRRRRASQDSEELGEEEESASDSAGSGGESVGPIRQERAEQSKTEPARAEQETRRAEPAREGKESECESEDGIEGDVLSDYESADESEEEEAHNSEEDPLKTTLKQENNVEEAPATREQKPKSKGAVTGERQSGDGQESTEPEENNTSKKSQKQLDDDEDRKNPAYIPRKGLFFEHDLRGHVNDEEVRPKGRHPRKLWKDEGRWVHDRFREDEQAPKSREELVSIYGYDIRSCRNPEEIHPRRPGKPRFSSPSRREENDEKPSRPSNRYQDSGVTQPLRPYTNRNAPPSSKVGPSRTYSRQGGYKENRASYQSEEEAAPHTYERRQDYGGHRSRSTDQGPPPPREYSPEADPIIKEEAFTEKQTAEPSPPPPDRPVEKKSYSRARRSRIKVGDTGKSMEDTTAAELPPPPPVPPAVAAEFTPAPLNVKQGNWEPPAEGGMSGIDDELSKMNLSEQSWNQGQPAYISPRGIPNPMHMGAGPPQYSRMEGMAVQAGRVKRYSSQRQRPVPDPAAMHISLMESHYYDSLQFQGPIYAHGDSSPSMPPQGMIVQPEMHLSHPGMHPHQSPATISTPNIYPAPVSLTPGQPPPQQLLPPPYFTAPSNVMNFGNPTYPYPPGALPPPPAHLYPNAQAQSQVYGGVTYYNPVQQQVQQQVLPKPSPPRRTSQPVTIKPPPPEENRHTKMKEKSKW